MFNLQETVEEEKDKLKLMRHLKERWHKNVGI
jgi:hypothetical protein